MTAAIAGAVAAFAAPYPNARHAGKRSTYVFRVLRQVRADGGSPEFGE